MTKIVFIALLYITLVGFFVPASSQTYVNDGQRELYIPSKSSTSGIGWHIHKDNLQVELKVLSKNRIQITHRKSVVSYLKMYDSDLYIARGQHLGDLPRVVKWFYDVNCNALVIDYIHYSSGGDTSLSKREVLRSIRIEN